MNNASYHIAIEGKIPLSLIADLKSIALNSSAFDSPYIKSVNDVLTAFAHDQFDIHDIHFTAITGLSGTNWKIELGDVKLLAREINLHKIELGINRNIEYDILNSIIDLNIAPKPISRTENWLFVEWLESDIDPNEYSLSQLDISSLSYLVAKIHTKQSTAPILDIIERFQYLYNFISPNRSTNSLQAIHHHFTTSILPTLSKLVLTHMDIHIGNLVLNNGVLKLIDWEYAARADEHLALAVAIDALNLDHANALKLLSYYNAAINGPLSHRDLTAQYNQVKLWHPYILYLQLLWYEIRYRQTTDEFYLNQADKIQKILIEIIK